MPYPSVISGIYGLPLENYVFIKCVVCNNYFRWGRRGVVESVIRCPWCGALVTRPKYVDKSEYRAWAERMDKMKMHPEQIQRRLWDLMRKDTDVI